MLFTLIKKTCVLTSSLANSDKRYKGVKLFVI